MKLKTILALFGIPLLVSIPYLFFTEPANRAILDMDFVFFGLHFSVQSGMLGALAAAMVLPSLYFTRLFFHARSYARRLEKDAVGSIRERGRFEELEDHLAHGQNKTVLERLSEIGSRRELLLKARAHIQDDQPEVAVQLLSEPFEASPEAATGYLLADALEATGQSSEPVLSKLVQQDGNQALEALRRSVRYHRKQRQWPQVIASQEQLEAAGEPVDAADKLIPRLCMLAEDEAMPLKKRIESIQRVLKEHPENITANVTLGDAYMDQQAHEKAFRIFEQAFEQTRHPVFLDRLEQNRLRLSQPQEAIAFYRRAMVKDDSPRLKFRLGRLYFQLEMLDEALDILEPLTPVLGKDSSYLVLLSEIEIRRGRIEDAASNLQIVAQTTIAESGPYRCTSCDTAVEQWQSLCPHCGGWETLDDTLSYKRTEYRDSAPLYF